ncbi:MAG: hypothetical protein L0099_07275 [Acidobacteria bacterium]|nr:hypothetical protein [Acidobacteriota bacterium]
MSLPQDPNIEIEQVLSIHEGAASRNVAYLLGESQVVHTENQIINKLGIRETRQGARAFGGRAESPGGIGHYNEEDFDELLVGVWGTKLYKSAGAADWTQIASAASFVDNSLHDFVRGRSAGRPALVSVSVLQTEAPGRTKLFVYLIENDKSTQASVAPRCIAIFQNRVFYGEGQVLGWSEIDAPASYSSGNTIVVEPGLFGEVTAIVPARDQSPHMFIFKHDAVLIFAPRWGSSSAQIPTAGDALDTIESSLRVLTSGAGCVATKSAIWVPGEEGADVYFLAADGIRSLRRAENDAQAGAGLPISYSIPDIIDRINWTHAHRSVAAVHDNAYHIGLPLDGAASLSHVLRYDLVSKGWSLLTYKPRTLHVASLGGQARLFMQNGYRAGDTSVTSADTSATQPFQVYQLFTQSLDPGASSVAFREDSRAFIFGDLDVKKRWDSVSLLVSSEDTSSVVMQRSVDFGPYETHATFLLSGGAQAVVLGEDALAWQSAPDLLRKRSFGLQDVRPGYALQIRLLTPTGATETGRLSIYQMKVGAFKLQDEFLVEP